MGLIVLAFHLSEEVRYSLDVSTRNVSRELLKFESGRKAKFNKGPISGVEDPGVLMGFPREK